MKKLLMICLTLLLLATAAQAAEGETISYGSVCVEKHVEYLDMGQQIVEDWNAFVAFLSELPELQKVDMFSTVVKGKDIRLLEEHFPQIQFGWTIHFADTHYIRTDQTAFSTLHGNCRPHTSRELEVLKYCTELRALDIGHNDITDISFLENLPRLRVLILACNKDLRSIKVLSQLKDLEYLELFSCSISDISPLTELPHLMDLNIAYNQVYSYDGLSTMTQLKRLWLPQSGAALYGDAFRTLSNALPQTLIINSGHPTSNGWRDGNHYETIYSMFRKNEYIPFEDSWALETP